MRQWREDQAERRAQLPEAVRRLVIMAGELRAACACPPGGGCPDCQNRRDHAAALEDVALLIAPLARTAPFTGQ